MDGHKVFLLCRVKLAMVSHMYRFCVNIMKGRRKRNGKILFLLCEAEVSKGCNLKFGTVNIFTMLVKDYNLFKIITVVFEERVV